MFKQVPRSLVKRRVPLESLGSATTLGELHSGGYIVKVFSVLIVQCYAQIVFVQSFRLGSSFKLAKESGGEQQFLKKVCTKEKSNPFKPVNRC